MPIPREEVLRVEYALIACELHDGPCQYLFAAQTLLESLRGERNGSSHRDDGRLDNALGLLDRANTELRRLIRGLQPVQLTGPGVLAIVEYLHEENAASGGPEIEWCMDPELDELPSHLKVPILRILQECLANVRRHSGARRALVGVTQDDESISIQVQDWGIGFDQGSIGPDCHGLNGIRQRARLADGTVTIESQLGKGTCIVAEFPFPEHIAPAGVDPSSSP